MKRRLFYALSALLMMATLFATSCSKGDDPVNQDPAAVAVAKVVINDTEQPITGIAKFVLQEDGESISNILFSCTRSQSDIEDGTVYNEIVAENLSNLKYSGVVAFIGDIENIDLTKPLPSGVSVYLFFYGSSAMDGYYIDAREGENITVMHSVAGELTILSGTLSVSIDGAKVSLNLNATLSSGDSFSIVCESDNVPDMYMPILVDDVKVDKSEITLEVGQTDKITITEILPSNADEKTVVWSSSTKDVFTVDQEGNVTAVGVGEAFIYMRAADGGFSGNVTRVKVVPKTVQVTEVTLDRTTCEAIMGDAPVQLVATILPEDATNKNVKWESADETVVSVNDDGLVTIVGGGETTVTVTTLDGEHTAQCVFTIEYKATDDGVDSFKPEYL